MKHAQRALLNICKRYDKKRRMDFDEAQMTKAKLESLLTALRAASGPSRELDVALFRLAHPENDDSDYFIVQVSMRYTASLDAAAAFRERMLPGWYYSSGKGSHGHWATILPGRKGMTFTERCATECLSMCAAVVAGWIAQGKKRD